MFLLPCLLASMAAAQDDVDWLLVGNSYTARNQLSAVLARQLAQDVPGWRSVEATGVTAGGKTLTQHHSDADGSNGDTALRQHLVTAPRPWQVVMLQEQSQTPGLPDTEAIWTQSRDSVLALDDLVAATGADTLLFLTWGRREGDPQNAALYPDFSTMQDRLSAGYLAYADAAADAGRTPYIAPVGEAFRAVHDGVVGDPLARDSPFWELYSDDGSHPSLGGTQLIAATTLAAWTGRRPTPLDLPGLDTARQEASIAAAVSVTVDAPLGPFPQPWVHPWDDWSGPIDGQIQRPLVWLDHPAAASDLTVGDGRLWLLDGAGLTVESLTLGPLAELSWAAGILSPAFVTGDLVLPSAGQLVIRDQSTVLGRVSGAGTIAWTGSLGGAQEAVILTATELDLTGIHVDISRYEVRGNSLVALAPDGGPGSSPRTEDTGCGCWHGQSAAGICALLPFALTRRRRSRW